MEFRGNLVGYSEGRQVILDGKDLPLLPSLNVSSHSPDGFNWGYGGSGPAQLALAVMLEFLPIDDALRLYQEFNWDVIGRLPMREDFSYPLSQIKDWIRNHGGDPEKRSRIVAKIGDTTVSEADIEDAMRHFRRYRPGVTRAMADLLVSRKMVGREEAEFYLEDNLGGRE